MKNTNKAYCDGIEIKWVARWGKNGQKYVWENPTQDKLNELIEKWGVEQISHDGVWLNY